MKPLSLPIVALVAVAAFTFGFGAATLTGSKSSPPNVVNSSFFSTDTSSRPSFLTNFAEKKSALTSRGDRSAEELASSITDVLQISDHMSREGQVWELLNNLNAGNAKEIVKALRASGNLEKRFALDRVLYAWAQVDPQAAIDYAQKIDGSAQRQAMLGVLATWALNDYDSASQWAETLPDGALKRQARQNILTSLAESDPERALQVAEKLQLIQGSRFDGGYDIFKKYARMDPAQAAQRAQEMPSERTRETAIQAVASTWMQQDREAALEWVETIPYPQLRQTALTSAVLTWARYNFNEAADWIRQRPPGSERDAIIRSIGSNAASNPGKAIELTELVGSRQEQDLMLRNIANSWAQQDAPAARAWATEQTDPAVRDVVYEGLVRSIAWEDPQTAMKLALSISSSNAQREAISNTVSSWAYLDRNAARKWVQEASNLNADFKQKLLSRLGPL